MLAEPISEARNDRPGDQSDGGSRGQHRADLRRLEPALMKKRGQEWRATPKAANIVPYRSKERSNDPSAIRSSAKDRRDGRPCSTEILRQPPGMALGEPMSPTTDCGPNEHRINGKGEIDRLNVFTLRPGSLSYDEFKRQSSPTEAKTTMAGPQTILLPCHAVAIFAAGADRPASRKASSIAPALASASFFGASRARRAMIGDTREAIEAYCVAVGVVVYEWNDLHEKLARLFALVRGGDTREALTAWYAGRSDTRQREMLRCAITETTSGRWKTSSRVPDDLKWLLDRADRLASDRNNAIHTPCSLYLRGDGSSEVMAAVRSANAGNRHAKNLEGKNLLIEFHWCAAYAVRLGQFAGMLAPAMASPDHYEWPERPKIPSRADFSGVSRR